jgi:MoxR-like ATPase
MSETVMSAEENRFDIAVGTGGVKQGGKTHSFDSIEMEQKRTPSGGEQRQLHASGSQIARASSSNNEAFRELGTIFDAIQEAEEMSREKDMSDEDVENIALTAMDQTQDALELANDAGEAASSALNKSVKAVNRIKEMEEEIEEAKRMGGGGSITIEVQDGGEVQEEEIEGLVHKQFRKLLEFMTMKMHVLLVGAAGTGKTHAVKQAAKALGLDIEIFRGHKHAVADDLFGFVSTVDGKYVPGPAYHAVKNGKLLYVDEFDVCTPSFVKGANNLTDNSDYVQFPNGERVEKHEDFVLAGAANTVGQGATSSYTGASGQLDASSLDRLAFIDWEVDENIEETIAQAHAGDLGLQWAEYVQDVRSVIDERKMTLEVTPRATIKGAKMLARDFFDLEDAREGVLTGMMTAEQEEQLEEVLAFEDETVLDEEDHISFGDEEDEDLPW